MDRRVFVEIVDRKVIGRQVVPNVARVVARVMMARDRARKASQAKAKLMMAKEKAKVASGNDGILQSLLEMETHGKGLFHQVQEQVWQRQKCKQS